MKRSIVGAAAAAMAATTVAQTVDFNGEAVGSSPAGWLCGVTGKGAPKWAVSADPETKRNVLLQSGSGTFPWCVRSGSAVTDGSVETTFKTISGREDRAGGVVWRWKDGDNYYVARANALENNVSLYYTERGSRRTLKYVDAPVATGVWHKLRVDFAGTRITVSLDGKRCIELDDAHIAGPGSVGVWTKADSVTAFRDFAFTAASR
jgi:FtsP/CotA-like multicopper oxidase with cupredoxin domain